MLAKLTKMWPQFGDRDSTYLERYRMALLRDQVVIGAVVQDENQSAKARRILKNGGARFLVYFGQFVVEVLDG
jgi:hypothetical protein